MKTFATAGTFESNDCMVTVKTSDKLVIEIQSVVFDQFGDQIKKVAQQTLKEMKIEHLHVFIKDKGALDYTIIARIKTACKRLGVYHA